MTRRVTGCLVVLTALAMAAGCSGDDDDADASDRPTTTTTTEAAATTTGEAPQPLFGTDRALVIAHAGGERDYPKETMFAFGEAVEAGADMLEFDVHLSADGQIVLMHDDTVDATTDATGPIAERTAAELGELDAAHWFVEGCGTCHDRPDGDYTYRGIRTGEHPPPEGYEASDFGVATLAQVAERFPDIPLDIEIKPEGDTGMAAAEALAEELVALGRTDSAVVVSFDQTVVDAFRRAAPDVAVSPGITGVTEWFLQGTPLDDYAVIQVPPRYEGVDVVTPETLDKAHQAGLDVWVWMNEDGQDSPEFYAELLEMGVDGIIADHPGALAALVDD